jgi:hypothetical protein
MTWVYRFRHSAGPIWFEMRWGCRRLHAGAGRTLRGQWRDADLPPKSIAGSRRAAQRLPAAAGPQHHRDRFGQGWGGEIHYRGQSGLGAGRHRIAHRRFGCRYLRPQYPNHARPFRQARKPRRQIDRADACARGANHVDRLPGGAGHADDLARADGHVGPDSVIERHALGWFRRRPVGHHGGRSS